MSISAQPGRGDGDGDGDGDEGARPYRPLPTSFTGARARRRRLAAEGGVDLVHPRRPLRGGKSLANAVVDCAVYSHGSRQGGRVPLPSVLDAVRDLDEGFVWIGLHEPDEHSLQKVADEFGLHPLAVEDAVHAHQRPKLETYGDMLFVALKTVRYVDSDEVIETGELMVFMGPDFVVTVRHGRASGLAEVRREVEVRPELLRIGPSSVLYAVMDRVVDGYLPAIEAVEQDVDETQNQVFSTDRHHPTERIYKLRREVAEFRRAVEPLAAGATQLARGEVRLVDLRTVEYFRDVQDHLTQAIERINSTEQLLDSALSANLAQVTMWQNEDMRKISAYAAIAAICTLVAGVYGMNFDYIPELHWKLGYPFAVGLMVASSMLLYRAFRRNGWL